MSGHILEPSQLEGTGIQTVIIASPDLTGRLIGRRVPTRRFEQVLEDGVDVCTCVFAWDVKQGLELIEANVLPLCGLHNGVPDVTLRVDPDSLRRAAWLDGVAICFADPVDAETGEPLALSPRVMLKRELARHTELGYAPKTGTELEFYLFANDARALRDDGFANLRPTTAVSSDFMIHEGNAYEPFFQKLRRDLADSGVEVEAAQAELGTGQWEMTFAYGDPLEMADRHSLYKLAVRDAAIASGMSATFMAKPLRDQPGSSCHVHVSYQSLDGDELFWDGEGEHDMSALMREAIGGVLEEAPGFMAWYAPTINSWRRSNSMDAAGWGRTWGFDNRTVTVRVVGHEPKRLRFEFRLPGADTNPYLTLAGLLASARSGIVSHRGLPAPVAGNAYEAPRDDQMPVSLSDAIVAFEASTLAAEAFGTDVVHHHATVLRHEWSVFLSEVSVWDLERYFDRI
ncbi:MAG: glutamine synthetase family protein [Acidimicrobiia bacterium]